MDSELQEVISHNTTFEVITYPVLVDDLVIIVVSIFSMLANSFIIYAVSSQSYMKTKRNLVILHWSISDLLFLSTNISLVDAILFLLNKQHLYTIYCFVEQLQAVSQALEMIFLIFIFIDCLYKRFNTRILPFIWILFPLLFLISTSSCITNSYFPFVFLGLIFGFGLVVLTFIVKVIIYCVRCIRKRENETDLRFVICSIYVLSWILSLLFGTYHLVMANKILLRSVYLLACVAGNSCAVITAIILICNDNMFKLCFYKIFPCLSPPNEYSVHIRKDEEDEEKCDNGIKNENVEKGFTQVTFESNNI